ncbi:MAG: DoxX family protein [Planctomycetota bacterium]|nr:DoxX family protein [Planctomycetota bacterium]
MSKAPRAVWLFQLAAAAILAQTLWFKFSSAPEAVHIFSTLGMEPWGRFLTASVEAVAVVLLLMPATAAIGGLVSVGTMSGALLSHFTVLGIEVQGDGGTMFALAWVVLACGALTAWLRRAQLPFIGRRLARD